jgi:EAL domain-containing protein (putative c-di-GMP-specific phosphodiesterase class I)
MASSVLENYLKQLHRQAESSFPLWADDSGEAYARYFNWTLNSVFQPVRSLQTGRILGFEAFARSYTHDMGLSVWKLLDGAASDEESIALDRLCRMLHSINFFRQRPDDDADLFLSVHERLLTAVEGNHGLVFRQVLDDLELPAQRVVLQLPTATPNLHGILLHVVQSYRSHGFRVALNAASVADALKLAGQVRPDLLKLDSEKIQDRAALSALLNKAQSLGVALVFKRLDTAEAFETLRSLGEMNRQRIYAQGALWDMPHPDVHGKHCELQSAKKYLRFTTRHAA